MKLFTSLWNIFSDRRSQCRSGTPHGQLLPCTSHQVPLLRSRSRLRSCPLQLRAVLVLLPGIRAAHKAEALTRKPARSCGFDCLPVVNFRFSIQSYVVLPQLQTACRVAERPLVVELQLDSPPLSRALRKVPGFTISRKAPLPKKGEPVPPLEASKKEDTECGTPEKGEPVPLLEASKKEITEANRIQKTNSRHNGSVLIFKDGVFIPNKAQILEEHESYTVFKVFAVKQ